ncbi:MAG: ammonia channel protein, partial [Asticcacaulis sp. 32-58-5]
MTATPATDAMVAAASPEPVSALLAHQAPLALDPAATVWVLISTALVLLMTLPGLALFYGGMVRKKNLLATLAQSVAATILVSVLWIVIGYSLSFGVGPNDDW